MAVDTSSPRLKFVPQSGSNFLATPITLQTGSSLGIGLVPAKPGFSSSFSPFGVTVSADGAPRFSGQITVQFSGLWGGGGSYRITGLRPGPARVIAVSGMTVFDTLDVNVVGRPSPGMVVLDALESLRLTISADQAKVLRESITGASKSTIVDDSIINLLGALLQQGSVGVLSLLRRGESQHGVVVGSQVFAKAVDINSFKGTAVISNDGQNLVDLVCSMLELFPEGDFDLGFPRPVGGPTGFDKTHDVFFSVPDLATAAQCFAGTISRTLDQMLEPAQSKVRAAMTRSNATFHVMYPDGLNHLHVNLTRFPGTVAQL